MRADTSIRVQRLFPTLVSCGALLVLLVAAVPASAQRSLGLDVSAWQGDISQATWDNIHNVESRDFVFIRSSRGGTTGYYNQSNPNNNNPPGQNNLSQRYDDPYFVQNISRATNAGMFAGPYHFSRPDIIATTQFAGGIANTGADEADHFIQMAGAWMRPGYLLPVHDLEAGITQRSSLQLSQFAVDFSNRIYEVMGIRPMVYTGQNYANYINASVAETYPDLWIARWPQGSGVQFTGDLQNDNPPPSPATANVYGQWNPNHTVGNPYPNGHPWKFWQYSSGERLPSFDNGNSNLDGNVANGGIDFLKDHLVPAVWLSDSSGDWNTLANWNSGQTPVAPVQGPGQVPRVGPLTLPTPRLPGADDVANNVFGINDTVILDRPTADITVTLSSGSHFIRKLYVREKLDVTGGELAGTFAQVDAAHTLALGGGTIAFNTIHLMPHSSTPGKLAVNANVDFSLLSDYPTTIQRGAGPGTSGFVDLGGAVRTFNIADGPSDADLAIHVPVTNGGLIKSGVGTLAITGPSSVLGDTTVQTGTLRLRRRAVANTSSVYLASGATLDLTYTGRPDIVRALYINGVAQAPGVWGAVDSGAQFTSPLITGTGMLRVDPSSPPDSNAGDIVDDFEDGEGHFGWNYNLSPISQTFGLAPATTIDRVTTEHQGQGGASQLLNLVQATSSTNWQLRHNSGIGDGLAARPEGNLALDGIGSVGFWLKTDDAGITVRIGIDDPVDGNNALERGVALNVIADNQWHLYQWNLENELHWEAYSGGANGFIEAALGTVTIDSIWFAGSGNAQIYLDSVVHNPDGPIDIAALPGDFNNDGAVNAADYILWRKGMGSIYTQADYNDWRTNFGASAGGGSGVSPLGVAVPEPSPLWLACGAAIYLIGLFRRRIGQLPLAAQLVQASPNIS